MSTSDTAQQLGRYQLVKKLATGGMAEVFLAKTVGPMGFEKTLVIKRILPHLAEDPAFVEMFLHEAKLAAQFSHPNVVQIFDFGVADGAYYLAMEHIDGPNLRSVLRAAPERRLSPVLSARLVTFACEGLSYAHEFADQTTGEPMGITHRDVSSDNLLISRNGTVKVVDFGVAKVFGQGSTRAGVLKGKIAYMSPEQIMGAVDRRSDVYALGVILYEMASGARPYDQKQEVPLLTAILQEAPVPLRSPRRPSPPPSRRRLQTPVLAR
jgi:serine/threonine-protein kinase